MKNKTPNTILGMTILLACGFTSANAYSSTYKWDMPNEYPATSLQGKADQYFSSKLAELSDGRIEVVHHFGGSLGIKSKDQIDAVGDGVVQIANTFIPPLGGYHPIFLLSSLPFLSSNTEEAYLLYQAAKDTYDLVLEDYNQKLLFASPWLSSGLWGETAYTDIDSLQSLKMRTYDANGSRVFRELNSSPIQLSWADIVSSLSTNSINAVLTSVESGLSASFDDYVDHFTALNYDSTINLVTINLDVWNKLLDEDKEIVAKAANLTEEYVWSNAPEVLSVTYDAAKARGVTVVDNIPDGFLDELREASAVVIKSWKESMGDDGEVILSDYYSSIGAE